jgi:hypothetical protein
LDWNANATIVRLKREIEGTELWLAGRVTLASETHTTMKSVVGQVEIGSFFLFG